MTEKSRSQRISFIWWQGRNQLIFSGGKWLQLLQLVGFPNNQKRFWHFQFFFQNFNEGGQIPGCTAVVAGVSDIFRFYRNAAQCARNIFQNVWTSPNHALLLCSGWNRNLVNLFKIKVRAVDWRDFPAIKWKKHRENICRKLQRENFAKSYERWLKKNNTARSEGQSKQAHKNKSKTNKSNCL